MISRQLNIYLYLDIRSMHIISMSYKSYVFTHVLRNFENELECFIGFPNARIIWNHEAAGRVVLLFSSVWKPDETRSTSFWNYFSNKEISLNYHLNKFSQLNYYIWDVKYAWSSKKCVWCAWSYHLIAALWQFLNVQQLRSRYLAVCQFQANTLVRKANGRVQIYTS